MPWDQEAFPDATMVIAQARADAITASDQLAALKATRTYSGPNGWTIVGNGGVNVIDVNGDIRHGGPLGPGRPRPSRAQPIP
jgi:hypothetical protein